MTYRRGSSRVHRLFVACYPSPEASENLVRLAAPDEMAQARLVPVHHVHLTLLFLGDTHERQVDEVGESVARSVAGLSAFELRPVRLVTLPREGGSPRVLAVEVEAHSTVMEIHRRLVTRLARPSQRRRGEAFLPHLTIARYPAGIVAASICREVVSPDIRVGEVRLMASELRPQGAVHREVCAFALEPSR